MSNRISVTEALEYAEVELDELVFESIVPACCEDMCQVEPDGTCPHGHPSVLLALGVI
jgi:hypothetical protein